VLAGRIDRGKRGAASQSFIGVLYNVMNLLKIQSYAQEVVLGAVILIEVLLDQLRRRYLAK